MAVGHLNDQVHTNEVGYYSLSLRDESNWWISTDNDDEFCIQYLSKFAAIMKLTEHQAPAMNGLSRLIIFRTSNQNSQRDAKDNIGWPAGIRFYNSANGDVVCEFLNDGMKKNKYYFMPYFLYPIYQCSIEKGGLPIHAALIELEGRGVLLSARCNTGKTTCCRRLPDYWKELCDDEALVVLDNQKKYWANPFPTWSDYLLKRSESTWNVQYSVPLCGIFFLEQSTTDDITPMGYGKASALIAEAANTVRIRFMRGMDKESQRGSMREMFDNACRITKMIPAFHLHVSLNGRFWEKIEEALGW